MTEFAEKMVELGRLASSVGKKNKRGLNYKVVEGVDVIASFHAALQQVGLYIGDVSKDWSSVEVRTEEKFNRDGESVSRTVYSCICKVTLVITDGVNMVKWSGLGHGLGYDDKTPGKAQTYAYKYAIRDGLAQMWGEDEEAPVREPQGDDW